MTPAHDQVAGAALRWGLERPWARTGCVECAYAEGRLDAVVVSGLPQEHELQRREDARWHERWTATPPAERKRRKRGRRHQPPQAGPPRIGVFEAKATRSDLLADLRQRKMHSYSELATNAWLALTPAALLQRPGPSLLHRCRQHLDTLDLPQGWGVLLVRLDDRVGPYAVSIRAARRLREVSVLEVEGWTSRIARSVSWRLLESA